MALSQQNVKTLIPTLLQSTATAYTTLGKGILALDQLNKVSELLEGVICSLKEEHGKYDDLLKVLKYDDLLTALPYPGVELYVTGEAIISKLFSSKS